MTEPVPHLYIDVRMSRHSGIGTYLRNLVPRVVAQLPPDSCTLLEAPECRDDFASITAARREFPAKIYSLKEQVLPFRFGVRRTDVYWTPHYCFPALLPARHVVTVHDVLHLALPEFAGGFVKQAYARTFFRRVAAKAERILCVSQSTKNELTRLAGAAAEKIETVYNGVDPKWSRPVTTQRPMASRYFVFIGNVKPHKNLRRLVAAMREFAETNREHQLVIVGKRDGFITGDREVFREAEAMPGRVTFTGFIDDEAMRAYLQHADALVFPSLYEGFGLPIVEAMAAGCPVLASDIPVHREISGDAALYCDPHSVESIRTMLHEVAALPDNVRSDLVRRGRERVGQFSWERSAAETARLLQRMLGTPAGI